MPTPEQIAESWGWFKLKRGWYHVNAQLYESMPFLFPLCYATAEQLCEAESLTSIHQQQRETP